MYILGGIAAIVIAGVLGTVMFLRRKTK
jgi:hypothetical protein